jgi:lysophospholipase L1-like esterase
MSELLAGAPRGTAAWTSPQASQGREAGALRFAALGDSLTEGIGDPVAGGWRGWAALLADGLAPGPVDFRNLARSGAQTRDVLAEQLPAARELRPHLAAVLVGVNDTLRATYDIAAITARLDAVLGALTSDGTVVLTACLPDPGEMLRLPQPLARPLARRMRSVNTVVHALTERHGAVHVHAAHDAWIGEPALWSVDRLHPSERGHRALARAFHQALAGYGLDLGRPIDPEPVNPAPARSARAWWLATKGTAWVLERCHDLLPDLARLALTERRHRGPELLDHRAVRDTAQALAALPGALPGGEPGLTTSAP